MSKLPPPFKLKKSTSSIRIKKRKYSNKTPFPRQHLQNPLTLHQYITHKHTHTPTYIHTYAHTIYKSLFLYIYTSTSINLFKYIHYLLFVAALSS